MSNVIITRGRNYTVYLEDANEDGVYNPGERLGVREARGRISFLKNDVDGVLQRLGINEIQPGLRINPFRSYLDQLRYARQSAAHGDTNRTMRHLEEAEAMAGQAGIEPNYIELARIGRRCIQSWCDKRIEHADESTRAAYQNHWEWLDREIAQAPGARQQLNRIFRALEEIPGLNDFQDEDEEVLEVSET